MGILEWFKKDEARAGSRSSQATPARETGAPKQTQGPPRFPDCMRDGDSWITSVVLPSWGGFQIRKGPYGSLSATGESNGVIRVVFTPEDSTNDPLAPVETSAVRWLIEHEGAVHDSMMKMLLEAYPEAREQAMEGLGAEEAEDLAPPASSVADLKRLCGVVAVYVQPIVKEGMPFIGVEFGCTWDEEHGVGVLLHGERAVECGQADTAYLEEGSGGVGLERKELIRSIQSELRRLESGPANDEVPGGFFVEIEAACVAPEVVLARSREVLSAVLHASRSEWPSDEAWPTLLPEWFVRLCGPEVVASDSAAEMARWRTLTREEQIQWEREKPWSLRGWLHWFKPGERHWVWWDATTAGQLLTVKVVVQGDPFPWGSLGWLLRASGARDVECLD